MLNIEPLDTFLARVPPDRITRLGKPEMEISADVLPPSGPPQVFVLEQSR